jgi:type I restriction enzyme S subunit
MKWPQAALGEIAKLIRGITYKPSDVCDATTPSAVACMRTKNVQEVLDESDIVWIPASLIRNSSKYLKPEDILVSSANSWNLVGKGCWVPELKYTASAGGFISILRGNPDAVELRFLYHWFVSPQTQAKLRSYSNKTTNISNLDHSRTLATEIPLPPLEEQRRIAAILDKANQLRQLSHANLQSLDDLVRKVFSNMFGDPVDNERGWNSGCIGDFVAQFETGKSLGSGDGDVSDSLRIIRVSAVSSGNFKPEESKLAPKSYIPREHHFVQEGDLLFCRANTDMLIGEVAYVGQGVRDLLLSDKIWRFCWLDKSKSHALYVQQLFRHPSVRREIRRRATGTSGSMLNISQSSVLEIPIILSPADLQNKFQDIAAECRRLFLQNTRQAISLRLLSCSLNRSLLEN